MDVGQAMQSALAEQRRIDLFWIQCQACGGLGVVVDLANRWYAHDGDDEMLYGGKVCPDCGGVGSPT